MENKSIFCCVLLFLSEIVCCFDYKKRDMQVKR